MEARAGRFETTRALGGAVGGIATDAGVIPDDSPSVRQGACMDHRRGSPSPLGSALPPRASGGEMANRLAGRGPATAGRQDAVRFVWAAPTLPRMAPAANPDRPLPPQAIDLSPSCVGTLRSLDRRAAQRAANRQGEAPRVSWRRGRLWY